MRFHRIKIFYDGLNIEKHSENDLVVGFTTNCSFFSTHSIRNYSDFYSKYRDALKERPISFQIWNETIEDAIQQIDAIHSIHPSIFVKIPVVNSRGDYNKELFEYAIQKQIPVNITAVYTYDQIDFIYSLFSTHNIPMIVSIFGGPISDIGIDPFPYASYAVQLFRKNHWVQILYAGVREPFSILQAEKMGCHIATVPDGVIEKLNCDKNLKELSIERVNKFLNDAIKGNIHVR